MTGMSFIDTPDVSQTSSTNESQPQGPPNTLDSDISQPSLADGQPQGSPIASPLQESTKPELPPGKLTGVEGFYALMSKSTVLQEFWFAVMTVPIPGYPDIKPPPKVYSHTPVNTTTYRGRRYGREEKKSATVNTEVAVSSEVKGSTSGA